MSIALSLGNNLTTGGVFKPTAINNTSVNNVTTFASVSGGVTLNLISTQTASASSSISFTSSIDSTYDEYIFKFYNIHPSTNARFQFNGSTDGGSNYNITKTTTAFWAAHAEADNDSNLFYRTSEDLAQSTSDQLLSIEIGDFTGNDEHYSGTLTLYNPSNTSYVKNFYANAEHYGSTYALESWVSGYFNTTSAVNAIIFRMSTGTFDGVIKMYGVAKS